jgi:CDP-diacylglycerol--serine O-phosphatidyltransferase
MAMKDHGTPRSKPDVVSPRRGVYLLPNAITTAGLLAGFYSIVSTLQGDFLAAAVAILVANVFDVLDGRLARMTKTTTRFGIEYDSLADLIAFGVAPAVLVYGWALQPWGTWGWFAAATYAACGALRLARFNVQYETTEKRHFIGLPIPAAAEVIASLVLLYYHLGGEGQIYKHFILPLVTYALAALMVSNLKYFSFKETELYRRRPLWSLVAFILIVQLLITAPQVVLFVSFSAYALSGPVRWLFVYGKRMRVVMQRNAALQRQHKKQADPGPQQPEEERPRPRAVIGGKGNDR